MHRIYRFYCFIFFIFSTSHAMFMLDLPFNINNNIETLKKLQFDISFLKNKSSIEPRVDEVLLPGDFPIISINKKTIEKLKKDGKKIIHDAENFIQEKKCDINAIFEILPTIEKHKKRQGKLLELRKNKLSTENNLLLEIPKKQSITSWELVKKNKGIIAVTTSIAVALVLFMLKKIQDKKVDDEKTDEELLEDFNNTINNGQAPHKAKMKIVRLVMHRLIDDKRDMPLALLKSVLENKNNEIVHVALTQVADKGAIFWESPIYFLFFEPMRQTFVYLDDFDNPVYETISYRVMRELNIEALEMLCKHDLCTTLFNWDFIFFGIPESKKKEDCLLLLFQQQTHHEEMIHFPFFYPKDDNSYIAYNKALNSIELSRIISPATYKKLHRIILDKKTIFCKENKPSKQTEFKDIQLIDNPSFLLKNLIEVLILRFDPMRFERQYSLFDLVQSRIDTINTLLLYGGKIDDYIEDIKTRKIEFTAIENDQFKYFSAEQAKDIVCNALDTIAINIGKEKEFREQFFNYSHQKKHRQLLETLCQNYPRPAWWILRVLNDRSCDMAITDMSHISPFCFEQMNNLFKNRSLSDDDMEKEMCSWNDLMLFLLSKAPKIFTQKEVLLEKTNGEPYTVLYKDQKEKIDRLPLRIVEQGFYKKPKTYELLRPLLEYCIMNNEFIPDISVQNGNEGSIIHLFAWDPFDMDMIKRIFAIYQIKDPTTLHMACSRNRKQDFSVEFSTAMDIAKKMKKSCKDEDPQKYQEIIGILKSEMTTLRKSLQTHPQRKEQ